MVDKRLLRYFEEGVNMGNSLDELKESLLSLGWEEDEVDEARSIFVLNKNKFGSNNKKLIKNKPKRIIFVSVAFFFLAIWWISSFVYRALMSDLISEAILNWAVGFVLFLLLVFVGVGILRKKKKMRIVGIVVSSLLFLSGLFSLVSFNLISFLSLLLSLYILFELVLDKKVKNYLS